MSSHFTVVYDACTLYPAPLRDLLMHLALSDLFRARWSNMIHDEWIRNVHANRPDLKTFKSLTAVARQITGTHCSGPLFFGLNGKRGAQ